MEFEEWEPYYREILEYFGIEREGDEEAARILASLLTRDDCRLLSDLCRGETVTVCGNAPCLSRELDRIEGSIFAADAASEVLRRFGITPDAVFTDLDGACDDYLAMNNEGTIMVIHAHGDNIPLLFHWVPLFSGPVVGTTQARPSHPLHNFGGFSDGDRAAFAADALGADHIGFVGFDLDDPDVDPMKRGKLLWARKLLRLIGYEC
ncbi:MAG: DUF115 domain-containing protein [Methanoregulaceae archaeon]|jgi:hypothetical protein|nr:DUF115 domain-containing protein [Methanoregulaceae archaeon]